MLQDNATEANSSLFLPWPLLTTSQRRILIEPPSEVFFVGPKFEWLTPLAVGTSCLCPSPQVPPLQMVDSTVDPDDDVNGLVDHTLTRS